MRWDKTEGFKPDSIKKYIFSWLNNNHEIKSDIETITGKPIFIESKYFSQCYYEYLTKPKLNIKCIKQYIR